MFFFTQELVPHLSAIRVTTLYPKHEYNDEDNSKSLRELSLTPNATVVVSMVITVILNSDKRKKSHEISNDKNFLPIAVKFP